MITQSQIDGHLDRSGHYCHRSQLSSAVLPRDDYAYYRKRHHLWRWAVVIMVLAGIRLWRVLA